MHLTKGCIIKNLGQEIMLERLQLLENNITELKKLKEEFQIEDVKKDQKKEWALRYGLLESIQIMIDIACHIVARQNLGNAETYTECIELLQAFDYIDEDLERDLKGMAGLRNILVHEYVAVDIDQLYALLENTDDFNAFAMAVREYIE